MLLGFFGQSLPNMFVKDLISNTKQYCVAQYVRTTSKSMEIRPAIVSSFKI